MASASSSLRNLPSTLVNSSNSFWWRRSSVKAESSSAASGASSHLLDLARACALGDEVRAGRTARPPTAPAAPAARRSATGRPARLGSDSQSATSAAKSTSLQLVADRLLGARKFDLDEAAEIVGDAALVRRDDRGVRDGQAERPPEQRHHRVPVGDAADGGGLGEGGDEAEPRPAGFPRLGGGKDGDAERQSSAAIALVRRSAASFSASAGDRPRPAGPLDVSGWCVAALKVIAGRLRR